jgi:hypothetical protein
MIAMNAGTITTIVLVVLTVAVLPVWPYSAEYGYAPTSAVGIIALIVVLLWASGRL